MTQMIKKNISPKALEALQSYFELKKRHYNFYFSRVKLEISNDQFIKAYTNVFNLINDMDLKILQQKIYEKYETTFLDQYRNDLVEFCVKCKELFKQSKSMDPQDQQAQIFELFQSYKRFMNWILRIFRVIQRTSLGVKGIYLCNQGLRILRTQLIEPIYNDLFELCLQLLQLYKNQQLKSLQPLQGIIQTIGVCGFTKFRYVKIKLIKGYGSGYQYCSENSDSHESVEIPMQTDYFKKKFVNQLVLRLQEYYRKIAAQLIHLSAPQYISKAIQFLKKEEQAADSFYSNKSIKDLVIRSIQEVLVHQRAEQLLHKQNTGFRSMLEKNDIANLSKLFYLMKRSSNIKMLSKEYQLYIDVKGNSILDKVSPDDQKNAKKEAVTATVNEICELYQNIQKITTQISGGDVSLHTAQNFAFQQVCNKTNKLTNFLAYYADNCLRKDEGANANTQLVNKISKISKFLYSYDAFLKLYQKLLGLRILSDNFKNRETQHSIINLLKNQAGVNALNKISCMIADVKFSQTFNNQKMNYQNLKFGFSVIMLTSGSWQINDPKHGKSLVPPQLMDAVNKYQQIYCQWMPGRIISWLFNYGRAIALVRFAKSSHHLMLNNYQLLILLYLQRQEFKKVQIMDLFTDLKIDDQASFTGALLMLVKVGVILKDEQPMKIASRKQKVWFNMDFHYKSPKVACFQVPRYIQKVEVRTKQLQIQRSYLIDAAIVKAMKSKRVMQYHDLIVQVQKMCKTFKAEVGLIKKRIENCQQRQFLVRDEKDMNCLIYKP